MGLAVSSGCNRSRANQTGFDRLIVTELPRPNSGVFSYEEAGIRRSEIGRMAPSEMFLNWDNPLVGFSVHISARDELFVYNAWPNGLDGENPVEAETRVLGGASDMKEVVESHRYLQWGNPLGVLITSELGGASSAVAGVVDELWMPSVQIFYVRAPD